MNKLIKYLLLTMLYGITVGCNSTKPIVKPPPPVMPPPPPDVVVPDPVPPVVVVPEPEPEPEPPVVVVPEPEPAPEPPVVVDKYPNIRVSGPDAEFLKDEIIRQITLLGYDLTFTKISLISKISPTTGQSRNDGPYTCDDHGCWHGITTYRGKGSGVYRFIMQYPEGASDGLRRHEVLHITDWVTNAGIDSTNLSPGHPEKFRKKDRSIILAKDIIKGHRWPSIVSYLPGGKTPQYFDDPWAKYVITCNTIEEE